jgi:hypothetical protein
MKLKDIIYSKEDVELRGFSVENNIISGLDVSVIVHFGNLASLNIWCTNCVIYSGNNDTKNLGFMIKALVDLFDLTDEDGFALFTQFKNIPIRIVCEGDGWGSKVVGFGHFMKDKFVLKEDFCMIDEV